MKPTTNTRLTLIVLGLLAFALGAQAEVYIITLESGKVYETEEEPQPLKDNPGVTRFRTTDGQWIGVRTGSISSVQSPEDDQRQSRSRVVGLLTVEARPQNNRDQEEPQEPPILSENGVISTSPLPGGYRNGTADELFASRGTSSGRTVKGQPLEAFEDVDDSFSFSPTDSQDGFYGMSSSDLINTVAGPNSNYDVYEDLFSSDIPGPFPSDPVSDDGPDSR